MVQAHPRTTKIQVVESNEAVEEAKDVATDVAANMVGEGLKSAANGLINNEETQNLAKSAATEALSGGLTALGDASAQGAIKGLFSCCVRIAKKK